MSREAFEVWISAPPYERSVNRRGEDDAWPGQYWSYETQAAWEAWQESAKQEREACAKEAERQMEDEPYGHAKFRCANIASEIRARKG